MKREAAIEGNRKARDAVDSGWLDTIARAPKSTGGRLSCNILWFLPKTTPAYRGIPAIWGRERREGRCSQATKGRVRFPKLIVIQLGPNAAPTAAAI